MQRITLLYWLGHFIIDRNKRLWQGKNMGNKRAGKILILVCVVAVLLSGVAVGTVRVNAAVRNRITGTKSKGYVYVDRTGTAVKTGEIRQAVDFVMKNSSRKYKTRQRLRQCYDALVKYSYFHMGTEVPTARNIRSCARYMFSRKRGNRYYYAAAMAYIARVLGYDSRVVVGGVTARGLYAPLSDHGWCEIKIGSRWMICDCSMQRAHQDQNLFLVAGNKYPFRMRRDKTYVMTVKKGRVTWK